MEFLNDVFRGIISSDMYEYQNKIIKLLNKKQSLIINKSRQVGISFLIAGYGLFIALTGKIVLIVSPSERQSKHMMDYLRQFLAHLRMHTTIGDFFKEETKTHYIFKNNGQIISLPNSPNTVRGFKADLIILDEFAHFENDKEMWDAILPSITRGGYVVIISTPFGQRGLFWKLWQQNGGDFKKIIINYRDCKDMTDEKIKKLKEKIGDTISWEQEMENKFIGDIGSYFPYEVLQKCINQDLEYSDEIPEGEIIIGADIGRKIDQTAVVGICKTENRNYLFLKKIFINTEYSEQLNYFRSLLHTKKINKFYIDAVGIGNMLAEELRKEFGVVKTVDMNSKLKISMMTELKRVIEMKEIEYPPDMQLINALHSINRTQSGTTIKFDAERTDETGHADTAFALALAVLGMKDETGIMVIGGEKGLDELWETEQEKEYGICRF